MPVFDYGGMRMTTDSDIETQIEQLESERESLQKDESAGMQDEHRHANRLEEIRVDLDRLWDLRRQRQALKDAGEPASWASERDADTVEGYEQ
jgi:Protein of unknown function (DUF2630)